MVAQRMGVSQHWRVKHLVSRLLDAILILEFYIQTSGCCKSSMVFLPVSYSFPNGLQRPYSTFGKIRQSSRTALCPGPCGGPSSTDGLAFVPAVPADLEEGALSSQNPELYLHVFLSPRARHEAESSDGARRHRQPR